MRYFFIFFTRVKCRITESYKKYDKNHTCKVVTFWGVLELINEGSRFYIESIGVIPSFFNNQNFLTMNELKAIEIAQKFCKYLHWESTGSRTEFAVKLGISPQWVSAYRRKLEQVYGVIICFCRKRNTYFVKNNDYHKLPPLLLVVIISD